MHVYDLDGQLHLANASDISIPEALAPVVRGIASLHNFLFRRALKQRASRSFDLPTPYGTFGNGSHVLLPYDFATIYDIAPLWNQGVDGTGQTIAIVGRSNIKLSDIATFRQTVGLVSNNPQVILAGSDPGITKNDEAEAALDAEWAGAVAKGAGTKLVIAQSTNTSDGIELAASYAVNNNVASILSVSFGGCEATAPASGAQFFNTLWQQAAAQGMSVFVASGDSGSAACDKSSSGSASGGLSVNAIASTPFNVAVGGSQFNEGGSDSVYWNSTNNTSNLSSAKGYIPEVVWNESNSSGLASGGGGVSILYARPSWQSGFGVPAVDPGSSSGHHRYLPDISLTAAGHDGYAMVVEGTFPIVEGTSASTPAFAGIMAMINQVTGQRNGNPNPRLYALAAQLPSAFSRHH
jgi:subtilase family serine protease